MENLTNTERNFIIPIDREIKEFKKHLDANNRTILSAKFGDGKSYFLDKIKNNEEFNKEYKFLTIYPVNYQVVKNEDIFEILKRDIIFQLLLHNVIKPGFKMPDIDLLSWYLYIKGTSIAGALLPYLAEVGLEQEDYSRVLMAIKGINTFKSINEKFKDFINKKIVSDDDLLEKLIVEVDSKSIYECDPITKIIKSAICEYKKENNKKIVLIIEDMDRMDPAHMFRILNILSAHIDYCYKSFERPDMSLIGNKFDLDNIIVVIDYNNLENIYKHFYGAETDFRGYISKFLSSTPFYYSFENTKITYFSDKIKEITNLSDTVFDVIFPEEKLKKYTTRELINSLDIKKQIPEKIEVVINQDQIPLNDSILKAFAILRRLKNNDDDIVGIIFKTIGDTEIQNILIDYIGPFMFLDYKNNSLNERFLMLRKDYTSIIKKFFFDKATGKIISQEITRNSEKGEGTELRDILYVILSLIAK